MVSGSLKDSDGDDGAIYGGWGGEDLFSGDVVLWGEPWARVGLLHGYGDHCARYQHFYDVAGGAGSGVESWFDFRGHGRSDGKRGFVARWDEHLDDADAFFSSSRR
jgi:alpha-beta hydrolase superfamily lysophospholipase